MEELIVRHLQRGTTAEEEERIREWRARSPANERAYRSHAALWALTGTADPLVSTPYELPAVDLLIRRAETELDVELQSASAVRAVRTSGRRPASLVARKPRWLPRIMQIAAVAAFLVAGFGLGTFFRSTVAPSGPLVEGQITTGAGEMATFALADGTSIRVGPRSSIRLIEEASGPVAELNGRAFFAVRRDSARSFTVRTPQGDAVVLGTRFEVRAEEDEFRVLVVDGSVRVHAGGETLELKEAQMGRASGNARLSIDPVEDAYAQLDWMGNALVFQATPLARALHEVERRYSVSVVLMDSTLADLKVTATFTGEPLDQVVLVLCEISGASCSIDGAVVRIRARAAAAPIGTSRGSA